MNSLQLQAEAARELLIRRKARTDILHYTNAIEVPGRPIGDSPDTEFFEPVETTLADHHRLMLTKLDEISNTPHGRMMIFMPPGSAKSTYASVVFPSRYLGEKPNRKLILASYGDDLARKMGRRTRAILKQKRYKDIFNTELSQESHAAQEFSLTNGSEYMACGILGGVTGNRANGIIIDDPIKGREQADSETIRNKTFEAYEDDLKTRLIPGGWIVLIQCMTGDTSVTLAHGTEKPLRDIRIGDHVATYKNGELFTSVVMNWKSNGFDSVYEIKTKSGISVKANERHPFLVSENGKLKWIRTRDLRQGQEILRVNGGSGKVKLAQKMDVISQFLVEVTAHRITIRSGGLMALDRHLLTASRIVRHILSIATALLCKSTTLCLLIKKVSAQYVDNHQDTMLERTGVESSALTIATTQERSGRFFAMTAILLSGMQKLKKLLCRRPNISDFIPDKIVDITAAGIEEVFDIQIDGTENFIANGLVSHNTRWHEDDIAGRILPTNWNGQSGKILCRDGNEWEIICLQAKCEVENDPLGREEGEYLWPEWFDTKHWAQFEQNSRTWAALYQQLPVPRGGIVFNRNHWKFYKELPELEEIVISVDCTFKETSNSDYVAIQAWGNKGANDYLLKRVKQRMGFAATVIAIRTMKALYPESIAILVEDKANGSAVIETLSSEIIGIIPIQPEGGKVARAYAAQPAQEAGNVFLPDPSIDSDIETFLSEISSFPAGAHDDEVDACTQYLNWRRVRGKTMGLVEYMRQQTQKKE